MAAIPEPVLTPAVREMGILVDSHVARGMWAVMGATVAAEQLEWFRREYGQPERLRAEQEGGVDWDYLMQAAAASPPGAHGCLFLPHMSGSHCPVVDHRSLGAFVGLRNITTKGDMLRAIIEGLGLPVPASRPRVGTRAGRAAGDDRRHRRRDQQRSSGCRTRPTWSASRSRCRRSRKPSSSARPCSPASASGVYRDVADAYAQVHRPGRVYEPDLALNARYREWFAAFESLYPALQATHAGLRGSS